MATQAQILANQASAQHFTGPKSAGGKASASRNNLRDGLTVGVLVLDEAGRVCFCGSEAKTLVEMKANGLMGCEVFQQFIDAAARLNKQGAHPSRRDPLHVCGRPAHPPRNRSRNCVSHPLPRRRRNGHLPDYQDPARTPHDVSVSAGRPLGNLRKGNSFEKEVEASPPDATHFAWR